MKIMKIMKLIEFIRGLKGSRQSLVASGVFIVSGAGLMDLYRPCWTGASLLIVGLVFLLVGLISLDDFI